MATFISFQLAQTAHPTQHKALSALLPDSAIMADQHMLFAGVIQPTGLVRCAQSVGGPVNHECSLSEYEKLGNSKERRPGENVHLTNFSLALKVQH